VSRAPHLVGSSVQADAAPRVSIVIPSFDGERGGYVPKLLDSIRRQSFQDFEVHLVIGVAPQGRAINEGRARGRGRTLVIADDDSEFADPHVLERLIETLDSDERIGMAGASIEVSPVASRFQQRAAVEFPRLHTPVVDAVTESDLACHGCCAFPMSVFDAVGGEREDLVRGLDPDLRMRLREAGYRVVLAPRCRIYHPMPPGWRPLMRTFFRNGRGSAYAMKYQPDSVYETHESLDDETFRPRTTLAYRAARFPVRLAAALARGQLMRFTAYTAYACGYVWGWMFERPLKAAS